MPWARLLKRSFSVRTLEEHLRLASSPGDLRKCLGTLDLFYLGLGSIVGAGVYVLSGVAAHGTAGPAVVTSYVLAAAAALFSALSYAEYAVDVPVSGGAYNYIYITFGELAAWSAAWNMVLETTLSSAAVARGFSGYLATLVGLRPEDLRVAVGPVSLDFPALLLVAILSLVLAKGTKETSLFNMVVCLLNIGCIVFVLAAGFPQADVSNLTPFAPFGVRGVFSAASILFFSYIGFDYIANCAEEAVNPTFSLPVSIVASLCVATALYCLMSLCIVTMVPSSKITVDAPFSAAFLEHNMGWAALVVSAGAVAGITTSTMTGLLSQARLFVVLGREHLLPPWLAVVNQSTGTPIAATLLTGACAGLLALFIDIGVLAELVSVGTLYVFFLVCTGVLARRYHQRGGSNGRRIGVCLASITLASIGVSAALTSGAPWVVLLVVCLLWAAAVAVLYVLPVAYVPERFRVPLFPLTPALGMLFTVHLMGSLGILAYVRFAVWNLAGLAIYAAYGVHRAEEKELAEIELTHRSGSEESPGNGAETAGSRRAAKPLQQGSRGARDTAPLLPPGRPMSDQT